MTLGIIMKRINSLYEKNMIDFFLIFIPELIFMLIFFGYMDALIFLKWTHKYDGIEDQAPDIKSFLMDIILEFGKLPSPPAEGKDWELYGSRAFFERLHLIFLIVGIACLLIMLVPPIFLNFKKAKKNYAKLNRINVENNDEANENLIQVNLDINQENQEPLMSDFVVASIIETIEFALGAISNTASYLRLWALSLAHSQLSKVFFEYSIGMFSRFIDQPVVDGMLLAIIFVIYGGVTFGVLLCMDFMECFLHTLRLHWVEFQNKFFKADGHKFQPFCFEINIEESQEEFI
jgi:V-type H+-transporting ATPase subunit a